MLKNTSNILPDGNGHKFHVSVIAYSNYGTFALQHPPSWQAQNTVHERFALLQLHLNELQGVQLWHPHLMSFRTESGARFTASVIAVGTSDLLTSSFFHPYFSTSNSGGSSSFADRQIDAWWWARFTFFTAASVVGGSEHNLGVDTCPLPVLAAHAVISTTTRSLIGDSIVINKCWQFRDRTLQAWQWCQMTQMFLSCFYTTTSKMASRFWSQWNLQSKIALWWILARLLKNTKILFQKSLLLTPFLVVTLLHAALA